MKKQLIEYIDNMSKELIEHNLFIYKNPEASFKEMKTSKNLADWINEKNFHVEMGKGLLSTAFLAKKTIGTGGINIGFIAEYDALEKLGHACGHNLIATMSCGAAFSLAEFVEKNNMNCQISIIGTPAEESGGGKIHMIKEGYFDNLDFALMLHPSDRTMVEDFSFANVIYTYKFFGKSAHASAAPWEGNDAVEGMLQALNLINGHRSKLKDYSRINPLIIKSGNATNVISDYAEMAINIRSCDDDYLDSLVEIVKKCAESSCMAYGLNLEIEQTSLKYESVNNSRVIEEVMEKNFNFFGEEVLPKLKDRGVGSTDMGNVTNTIPSIHGHIELRPKLKTHTKEFRDATITDEGARTLLLGAKVLAMTAYDILSNEEAYQNMINEFQMRGRAK